MAVGEGREKRGMAIGEWLMTRCRGVTTTCGGTRGQGVGVRARGQERIGRSSSSKCHHFNREHPVNGWLYRSGVNSDRRVLEWVLRWIAMGAGEIQGAV